MMLVVKRVKLPASGWLNWQDKPLPATWDVPRPVQFDSDVRKRVITVEANTLEKRNPIQADGIKG